MANYMRYDYRNVKYCFDYRADAGKIPRMENGDDPLWLLMLPALKAKWPGQSERYWQEKMGMELRNIKRSLSDGHTADTLETISTKLGIPMTKILEVTRIKKAASAVKARRTRGPKVSHVGGDSQMIERKRQRLVNICNNMPDDLLEPALAALRVVKATQRPQPPAAPPTSRVRASS